MSVTKNNRATGSSYEEKIAAFLKQNGFMILERNYRCKQGEIDIIAKDGKYFVFIEVKFRQRLGWFSWKPSATGRPCGSRYNIVLSNFPSFSGGDSVPVLMRRIDGEEICSSNAFMAK